MKEIKLTQGRVALVDDEDFELVNSRPWFATKRSEKHCWYAIANFYTDKGRRSKAMHWFIMNPPPGFVVDHIDGNGLNNQRSNLRICPQARNVMNACKHRASVSRFKGVTPDRKRQGWWRAQIQVDKKKLHLGYCPTEEDAATLYNFAAYEHFGEFARMNVPAESHKF